MKRTISFAVATTLFVFLSACGKSTNIDTITNVITDPLESFKVIAEKCQGALVESDRTWPGRNGKFGRTIIIPRSKSFDVNKTDSLVSPHFAYIKLSFLEQSSTASTEEYLHASSTALINIVN